MLCDRDQFMGVAVKPAHTALALVPDQHIQEHQAHQTDGVKQGFNAAPVHERHDQAAVDQTTGGGC